MITSITIVILGAAVIVTNITIGQLRARIETLERMAINDTMARHPSGRHQ